MASTPKNNRFSFKSLAFSLVRHWWLASIAAALVAVAVIYRSCAEHPPVQVHVVRQTRIDLTPEEIKSIADIGQWEFLSVSTEEFVEWHRKRTFGTDHLVRIYTGTLRIGVDMGKAQTDWFTSLPDSVARLRLPPVGLLDEHFIDEARTRSFYQKGSAPAQVYDELYEQARKAMLKRCLTPANLKAAEKTAREQFTRIFKTFGFKEVKIEFAPSHPKRPA